MAIRAPKVTVGRIYLKPLLPEDFEDQLDPGRILQGLRRELAKRVRNAIRTQDTFTDKAKTALAKAVRIEIQQSSVQITVRHPAWKPMVLGMQQQQMKWLTKARAPIPIITDTGELIFRSATPRSMADGKWVHPGYQKTNLLEKARKEVRTLIRDRAERQLRAIIRRTAA